LRISHDNLGTWVKEFKFTKTNSLVKKHYLDNATFLVLSIKVLRDVSGNLTYTINDKPLVDMSIYFGQYLSVHKNLSLIKKYYFDYDLSLNGINRYGSEDTEVVGGNTMVFNTEQGQDVLAFLANNSLSDSNVPQYTTTILPSFYDLYFGYSYLRNIPSDYTAIKDYEAIVVEQLSTVSESCFNWVKIINGQLETTPVNKSSSMLLDYRFDLKADIITAWIQTNFNTIFDDLSVGSFGSTGLDFNLILYPPSNTAMQFEDVPTIISPSLLNSNKVIPSVTFEVKRSMVQNAQKYFTINFIDLVTGLYIYSDNSYESPTSFKIDLNTTKTNIISFPLESSIFEKLTDTTYPDTKFKVIYTLPVSVSSYLSNNLNYKIQINISDLTSERS
jgi:hypothetical protein